MVISTKYKLLIISLFTAFQGIAQINYQSEYLAGKNYFRQENYQMAKNKFGHIVNSNEENPFYLYAAYFYGISAYQTNDEEKALEQYRQIRITHPQWDKIDELNIWYGHMLLDQGQLIKGLEVLNAIQKKDLKELAKAVEKKHLVSYDSIPVLQKALELNPYDKMLAQHLADVISEKPLIDRPNELLEFLIESFGLNKSKYDFFDKNVSQKKNTYNVAVMLPFMASSLSTSKGSKANQFILDLYQGIQLATEKLNSNGKKINLFTYDTKRDSATTAKILARGELLQMDLVIGPLYPDPVSLMKDYTFKNRINMINPLSTNSTVIGTNPYSFLLKSTPETRAKKAAEYVIENFPRKRATILYGSSSQDSIYAHAYRKYLEAESFKISWMERVETAEESTEVLKKLTTVFTGSRNGSMRTSRSVKVRVSPEDSLYLNKDSLGHIMVASLDNNILISNVLSAVDTRRDGLTVIGFEDWLDIDQISFEQLERMGVLMVGQNYFDFSSEVVANFKSEYIEKYNVLPTQFSYDGYEAMMIFGKQLIKYGNYFQHGLYTSGLVKGELFYGFDYTNSNDNQLVPILKLEKLDLKMLNLN
ncbi:hypothetical protein GCM10011506_12980 [Marivirga lumbricoides]|uniref:Leucine-binding protein domain-containing protein n=1 Tax=Marivirga lumbricoides TaxID=1046115 RepID=A0ABQ1LS04_9BACT|nr:hypothetical protein GCM10011506_12980 [Marivirga lumbricoides]